MSEDRQLVPVDHDPWSGSLVPVDHDPFEPLKIGPGADTPMERAVKAGLDVAGVGDVQRAMGEAGRVVPFLQRGDTAGAVGAGLGALAAGAFAGLGRIAPEAKAAERLFDYSRLAERPSVAQFDLERYVPPRGVPERTQALAEPANVSRVNEVVQRGIEQGGLEWYGSQPLRDAFVKELGEDAGGRAFQRYMDYVAATSPRSKVGENVRNASYYYGLGERGEPLPEALPSPYGHMAQKLHRQNALAVLSEGGWPVLRNPKPASFAQNLAGNWQPVTIDAHNARLWGLTDTQGRPVDLPGKPDYGFLERLQQDEAAKMGIAPAQYQAAAWLGGAEQTGVKSGADPFLKIFEDRVRLTANRRGETPKETLRKFIKGEAPLLSVGGASLSLPLFEDDER